jgi:hypothetical protein
MNENITINTNNGAFDVYKSSIKNNERSLIENLQYYQNTVDKNVTGWFYIFDNLIIHELLTEVQKNIEGDVCEIGVAFGKSAIALSNYRKPKDILYLYELRAEHKINGEKNIQKYGTIENIEWRIQDTAALNSKDVIFDRPLRFLHIDGCHEHFGVYGDLKLFSNKMSPDGVIVLDDYNDVEYPGVNSACLQFICGDNEWRIFAIGQNKAYLCRKDYYEFYVKSLVTTLDLKNTQYNFGLKFYLRQLMDVNTLLCLSRSIPSWSKDEVIERMFAAPVNG